VVLGAAAVLGDDLQLALELGGELVGVGQLVLGEQTGLDALGELDLLLGVEQRDLTDLLEVVLDGVGVAPAAATCWAGASSSSSSDRTKP